MNPDPQPAPAGTLRNRWWVALGIVVCLTVVVIAAWRVSVQSQRPKRLQFNQAEIDQVERAARAELARIYASKDCPILFRNTPTLPLYVQIIGPDDKPSAPLDVHTNAIKITVDFEYYVEAHVSHDYGWGLTEEEYIEFAPFKSEKGGYHTAGWSSRTESHITQYLHQPTALRPAIVFEDKEAHPNSSWLTATVPEEQLKPVLDALDALMSSKKSDLQAKLPYIYDIAEHTPWQKRLHRENQYLTRGWLVEMGNHGYRAQSVGNLPQGASVMLVELQTNDGRFSVKRYAIEEVIRWGCALPTF